MPRVDVADFLWDDDNEEKVALHGLLPSQVDELLDDQYVVDYNRRTGRADYLLIGRDYNGECIAVPIEETWEPTRWRPVTAWRCKSAEWARLRQVRRRR
jgi:hypothetical protein